MFKKILIANRGEIACRIIRTARRLGIETVAVYSDADVSAMHVRMADEAWRLGGAAVADSYLRIDRIVETCRASGAEAVHPGYGFLSENPGFVEALEAAGITFIGPSASAIRSMGLKDAAKSTVERAGVPVVPGYHGEEQDPDALAAMAREIGYPVLIKARAGGGGKGMRRVDDPQDFRDSLASAQREAVASFGDGRCLLEKYITKPRHIEIQVFGDNHGHVVHLFERDCSLQRRHQKVIEEAPAPGMTEAMRAAMGEAAVRAAEAIGYSGAGTIEFIADVSDGLRADRFYFMEMNTRLQVEHPVTEAITGQDLVEWQLRVASGEALPLKQDDLAIDGWAFEARIYAEDAGSGFLPATGTLHHLSLPESMARIDAGVSEGDEITPFYDPMIAKLIVHGPSREVARRRLSAALARSRMIGVTNNVAFLRALADQPAFAGGDVDTGLIERHLDALTTIPEPPIEAISVAALTALGLIESEPALEGYDSDPWSRLQGWRLWSDATHRLAIIDGSGPVDVVVTIIDKGHYRIRTETGEVELAGVHVEDAAIHCRTSERTISASVFRSDRRVSVMMDGHDFQWTLADPLEAGRRGDDESGDHMVAPMPGLIKLLSAEAGAEVQKGATMAVMEAMKMEHVLKAPRDGVIDDVLVRVGDQVEEGSLLLTFLPIGEDLVG